MGELPILLGQVGKGVRESSLNSHHRESPPTDFLEYKERRSRPTKGDG